MAADATFTEEKGAIVIEALRAGRRPGSAAYLVDVCRTTLYHWKAENEAFSAAWDDAVASATDKVEEVVYGLALAGDVQAAAFWLKYHRPHPYDRATMIKLGVLQASLAAAQANGNGRVVIDIGPDGLPTLPAPGLDRLRTGEPLELIRVLQLRANGREGQPAVPVDDGSGRSWPLPKRASAIMLDGVCMHLIADGAEVPSGAIPRLWKRIQLFNELARASQPVDQFSHQSSESGEP